MANYTTIDKVLAASKNIDPTGKKTSTFTSAEYAYFLNWADSIINSKLSPVCFVPLIQIQRNGVTSYPDPIEMIATNITAGLIVESAYARIEPQISDAGKTHKENAIRELEEICNGVLVGSRRLEGQVLRARNSFVNPYIAPLEPPKGYQF